MDDIFEKKIKEFLPYIIIIAALYFVIPGILQLAGASTLMYQIFYIGVFSIAAFACNFHYGYKKHTDLFLTFVAPVISIPSMLIYGIFRDSVLNSIIFLVSYFICGYLGQTVADMVTTKPDSNDDGKTRKSPQRKPRSKVAPSKGANDRHYTKKRVPKRVRPSAHTHTSDSRLPEDIEMPKRYDEFEYYGSDSSYDTTSTSDDIDAILNEIHNRNDF